jgi:aminoglycoside phosphotransferase (APT) family kinase protein
VIDPERLDEVTRALGAYLRERLGGPGIEYAEAPARVTGGNQTFVYRFRLEGMPGEFAGPLVLRVLRPATSSENVRLEAAAHAALIDLGFPAPRVIACSTDPEPFGGAFQIMERIEGRKLLDEPDGGDPRIGPSRLWYEIRNSLLGDWTRPLAAVHARLHSLDPGPFRDAVAAAGYLDRVTGIGPHLESLRERVDRSEIGGLREGIDWLFRSRPADPAPAVICHGDLFPNQVLVRDGGVTGVIDWTEVRLEDPAFDIGIVKAGLENLPLRLPGPFGGLGGRLMRSFARRYYAEYRRLRPVDPEAVRYYEALRCIACLIYTGERRIALRNGVPVGPNPYDTTLGVAALTRSFEAISGIRLRLEPAY